MKLGILAALALASVAVSTAPPVENTRTEQRFRGMTQLSRSKRNKKARKERLKEARRKAFEGN